MGIQTRLYERDAAMAEAERRLRGARQGHGGLLVVTGPAGIGRTRLAQAVAARAQAHGFAVRAAQGHQLEQDVPYGVLRQLLDTAMLDVPAAAGLADGGWSGHGTWFHDLHRSAAALAARRPLALLVDDAHWADPQSLRWLHFLARRSEGVPVLIAVFLRCGEESGATAMLAALGEVDPAAVIRLEPLGDAAISAVLADALGDADGHARLAAACRHSTGGNPFLLCELVGQIAARRGPDRAPDRPVGNLVSPAVSISVTSRLHALGPAAVGVARAAAVLGESGRIDRVAALAGVGVTTAAAQCDLLRRRGVLEPAGRLRFAQPLVAAAVRQDIPAAGRSLMHTRAARLMAASGAPALSVAGQLLQTAPAGDAWVTRWLRRAARWALDAGTPEIAAHYLERAMLEPPPAHERGQVWVERGTVAARIDPRSALPHFRQALQSAAADRTRCDAALGLAGALARCGRMAEADGVLAGAAAAVREPGGALRLRAERLLWNCWSSAPADPADRAALLAGLFADARCCGDRRVRQTAAVLRAWAPTVAGVPAAQAAAAVDAALADPPPWARDGAGAELPCLLAQTLLCAGRLEQARALLDAGLAELDAHGRRGEDRRLVQSLRAVAALRLGDLGQAERDAREAWHAAAESGPGVLSWWWSAGALASVLTARGELAGAQELAVRAGLGEGPREALCLPDPLAVRGRLRLAQRRFAEAAADLRAAGGVLEGCGRTSPSWDPWRADLALALGADARDEAAALAREALRRARTAGEPWALGRALRAAGRLTPGPDGFGALEESVRVLAASAARHEHAAALVEWGAALRRDNRRRAARALLGDGLALADGCGAAGLVERARRELAATGARPRRLRLTGPGALTPSEERVAALAADGLGNVQIAHTLQVTRKTVEKHLANTYQKLDIKSRGELREALRPSAKQ